MTLDFKDSDPTPFHSKSPTAKPSESAKILLPSQKDLSGREPIGEFGRYQLLEQLGRGSHGIVYRAWDSKLHRNVAIKVPRSDVPLSTEAPQRFLEHGKLLAAIESQAIVNVHDLGISDDGTLFAVMQYCEGTSLKRIMTNRLLTQVRTLEILIDAVQALGQAHLGGVYHRNFKPGNLIVDKNGNVHLVDFGMRLYEEATSQNTERSNPIGTPDFQAPEQVRGENHRIDQRTDIWAVGVSLYILLTGKFPFNGRTRTELAYNIRYSDPDEFIPHDSTTPHKLREICQRCLQKLMVDRYENVSDLLSDLKLGWNEYVNAQIQNQSTSECGSKTNLTADNPADVDRSPPNPAADDYSSFPGPHDEDKRSIKSGADEAMEILEIHKTRFTNSRELKDLPSLRSFLKIVAFAPRKLLDTHSRSLLSAGYWWYGSSAALIAVIAVTASLWLNSLVGNALSNTVQQIFGPDLQKSLSAIETICENPYLYQHFLLETKDELAAIKDDSQRFAAQCRLDAAQFCIDSDNRDKLNAVLANVSRASYMERQFIEKSLTANPAMTTSALIKKFDSATSDRDKASYAILELSLDQTFLTLRCLGSEATPSLKTAFAKRFAEWQADVPKFCEVINSLEDADLLFYALQTLAFVDLAELPKSNKQRVHEMLDDLKLWDADPGIFQMQHFLRDRVNAVSFRTELHMRDTQSPAYSKKIDGMPATILRLTRVPAGRLHRSEGSKNTEYSFSSVYPKTVVDIEEFQLSDVEVTVMMFDVYYQSLPTGHPVRMRFQDEKALGKKSFATLRGVRRSDACQFLNWLSRNNGLEEVYSFVPMQQWRRVPGYWKAKQGAKGFRLPTLDEMEWATRAGSRNSSFPWGDDPSVHSRFANLKELNTNMYRNVIPNRFGLFNTLGNLGEWCEDARIDTSAASDHVFASILLGQIGQSAHLRFSGEHELAPLCTPRPRKFVGFRIALDADVEIKKPMQQLDPMTHSNDFN